MFKLTSPEGTLMDPRALEFSIQLKDLLMSPHALQGHKHIHCGQGFALKQAAGDNYLHSDTAGDGGFSMGAERRDDAAWTMQCSQTQDADASAAGGGHGVDQVFRLQKNGGVIIPGLCWCRFIYPVPTGIAVDGTTACVNDLFEGRQAFR